MLPVSPMTSTFPGTSRKRYPCLRGDVDSWRVHASWGCVCQERFDRARNAESHTHRVPRDRECPQETGPFSGVAAVRSPVAADWLRTWELRNAADQETVVRSAPQEQGSLSEDWLMTVRGKRSRLVAAAYFVPPTLGAAGSAAWLTVSAPTTEQTAADKLLPPPLVPSLSRPLAPSALTLCPYWSCCAHAPRG